MESFLTELRLIDLQIFDRKYRFVRDMWIGVGFFIILKHLLNISYEQISKRYSPIVIATFMTTSICIFLSNPLNFNLKFFKMPALLG